MLWFAALVTLSPADQLHAIADRAAAALPAADVTDDIPAIGTCRRPDAAERTEVLAHVTGWIAKSGLGGEPELRFGCDELTGTLVDVHLDVAHAGYWWTLRVSPDHVDRLVEVTGISSDDWMEWAWETSASTLALADLDGDGRLDVVTARDSHEGGGVLHEIELSAVTTRTGKRTVIASLGDHIAANTDTGALVLAITSHATERTGFRCVGRDLKLGSCPEVVLVKRALAARSAIAELRAATADSLPDRDELAADLAALGIFDPALLGEVPPTRPIVHAQRAIAQFVDEVRGDPDRTAEEIAAADAADQGRYTAQLLAALGDRPCEPTTPAMLATARAGHKTGVASPACGPYVWVTWTHDTTRVQQLVLVGKDGAMPILRGEDSIADDPTWTPEPMLTGAFRKGGGAILREGRVDIVAGDDVVANQTGTTYTVHAGSVITDGTHFFHATAKGLEPLPPAAQELVIDHEAHAGALELLGNDPLADPAAAANALRVLGAPSALIAEVDALQRRL
jgi:hypothetical protein